jgi:acyl-coenzyme A thioesterase PaaI-like protein
MDKIIKDAIQQGVKREPFAQLMKMELVELEEGFSAVEMTYEPETMDNIFSRAHGGPSSPL